MGMIAGFKADHYRFLSNMYPCPITAMGHTFSCVEAAFQAAKCVDVADRARFVPLNGYQARQLGRKIPLRPDWEAIKLRVMATLLTIKFAPGTPLSSDLLDTHPHDLVESNEWGDSFWGVSGGQGHNHLGKLLMAQRERLRAACHASL